MVKRRLTPEQQASEKVEMFAPSLGFTLMRNNNGACKNQEGRLVRFGVGHISEKDIMKSGDFVGTLEITITPEMVGKTVPIYCNVEIKPETFKLKDEYKSGSREDKQWQHCKFIIDKGGFGCIVRSPDDLQYYYDHYMNWLKS